MTLVQRIRRWARGHTRQRRYSPVGIAFHWIMAALVAFQLWWGWRIGGMPVGYDKLEAYELHSGVGLAILVLALLRMAWRLMIPGPVNDADALGWQTTAAHVTHIIFYVCFIGLPLSGWAMLSATAREQDLRLAGLLPWPQLPFAALSPAQRWAIEAWAELVHFGLILLILVLIVGHVGAALKHEIVHRNDVLMGMLPGVRTLQRWVATAPRRIWKAFRPHPAPDAG